MDSIVYGERTKENVKHSLETYYEIPRNVMKNYEVDIELAIMKAKKSM